MPAAGFEPRNVRILRRGETIHCAALPVRAGSLEARPDGPRLHRAADGIAAVLGRRRTLDQLEFLERPRVHRIPVLVGSIAEDRIVQPESIDQAGPFETR